MTSSISTDDSAIQSGSSAARSQLDDTMSGLDSGAPPQAVHPRLATVVGDAREVNRRAAERATEGIDRTRKDSADKTQMDRDGADGVEGVNSSGGLDSLGGGGVGAALLGGLGAAGAALMGGGGQGAGQGGGAMMPPMSPVSAPTTGQSLPMSLSNPVNARLVAALLNHDLSPVGMGGLATAAGHGGGSGTTGPAGTGNSAFERKVLTLARQVVAAQLPYAWGGGTLNGPSQGIRDGGAADAAGDYAKTGFDCSGLARFLVYQASGVEIPRTSQEQFYTGVSINPAEARPGDLVFPSYSGVPPGHVQVYVGDGKVVEAQQSGTNLMFSNASAGTYKRYVLSN